GSRGGRLARRGASTSGRRGRTCGSSASPAWTAATSRGCSGPWAACSCGRTGACASVRSSRSWWPYLSGYVGRGPGQDRGRLLARGVVCGLPQVREVLGDLTSGPAHRLGPESPGAVGRTHQGTGHDAEEPDLLREVRPVHELLRLDPPVDRVVQLRGTEVLRDRQDVAAGVVQVVQRCLDLVVLLAHAEDQVGLGDQVGLARHGEYPQRLVIGEGRTDALEDAGDRLQVVRKDLRPGVEDLADQLGDRAEV